MFICSPVCTTMQVFSYLVPGIYNYVISDFVILPTIPLGADELKEKASRARKNFQSLKFLVTSSSSVIKALNKSSKFDLAKRVRDDVRGVLEGSRTLDEVMESQKELMDTHLAQDEKLTEKARRFDRQMTRAIEDDDADADESK